MKTILTLAVASFLAVLTLAQGQPSANEMNPEIAEIFSNAPPPPPGFVSKEDYLKSFSNAEEVENAYRAGKISGEEATLAEVSLKNKSSVDVYGKVVDQNGQPVIEAEVKGIVVLGMGDSEEHDTKTDKQGLFHFLRLHGQGMTMEIEKTGYYFNYMLPSARRPDFYVPDPNDPLVFTMWKLHGPEPMIHKTLHSYIPCDGTATRFDLLTGKKNPDGDLSVSLTRNPLNIDRRKPFDWTLTLQITNGGFQAITDIYPNEAPADGYQSSIIFHYESGSSNWTSQIHRQLYFKGENGQVYGRMTLKVMADFQPPPTLFDAEIYANPNGSRNLEFDSSKEIEISR